MALARQQRPGCRRNTPAVGPGQGGGGSTSQSDEASVLLPTGREEFGFEVRNIGAGAGSCGKIVHFIRHGESMANMAANSFPKGDPRRREVYCDPQGFDAPLSPKGLQDCVALRTGGKTPAVDLVASSPLTRALQTAGGVFGCGGAGPDGLVAPRLVVLEALREFNSSVFHPCDARRTRSELQPAFSHADFWGMPDGVDTLLGPGLVETTESADNRIHWLLAWLRMQPERSIACVSHGAFLRQLFWKHLAPVGWTKGLAGEGEAEARFANLEIRSVPLHFD